jgi:hypothetical protein
MALTQTEFEVLISDDTKLIQGDIEWLEDEDHSPTVEFRMEVKSAAAYPLFVRGSYNALSKSLSFTLIHRTTGRIYALDLGKDHHNPDCNLVGETHKHRWNEPIRDKEAYVPEDITASVNDPVAVWKQFCTQAAITHNGTLHDPPAIQMGMI